MDLEMILKKIFKFAKTFSFCLIAYLIAINIIRYGFFKTLFIVILVGIAFKLSDEKFIEKYKIKLKNKLED